MKKIFTLVFVSALGGVLTLGTYKLLVEKDNVIAQEQQKETPFVFPVSYKTAHTNLAKGETIDFTTAAEQTINTVVHVKNTTMSSGQMTVDDFFSGRRSQRPQIGSGSGVIMSSDGLIITNNHVIDGAETISVTLNNNKTYDAMLIGTDPKTDIALLKIEADEALPYTNFGDSDTAKVGEWVLAVGNPFNLTSTVTAGIISAKSRDLSGGVTQSFIQTDAAVNPGNSGGALVNTNGELIGINTAITSQTGSYVGYSFAVPSNIARKVVEDIMEFGNVQNGILGVRGGELNSANNSELGVEETEGFYVSDVEENSGAEMAGIEKGDIIKKLDKTKIGKFSDLKGYLNTKRPNDIVNVTVLRGDDLKTLPVKLLKNISIEFPAIGTLKIASKEELKKHGTINGLKISNLRGRYAEEWKESGIQEGDIVTAINGEKISSIEDVERITSNLSRNESLRVEIINKKGEKVRYRF